ncbi:cAMP-regulated D2 protein-like [Gigantopelta aegis]|uniref:cAMP-regulated D2 protein-like n=1 Tax=Gigantopelta aegis TaxID=1735272 RepID=UPI001B88B333|nr:cAMP-regulated D2 protein-like [Gigantopelta aegis]
MMLFLPVVVVVVAVTAGAADLVVDTKYGKVRGFSTEKSQIFYGIPYAQPPVDDLRWKDPENVKSWSPAVLNATELKPGCPQFHCTDLSPPMVCPKKESEDCLYMNIFAPLGTTSTSGLAVMLYLHGGNFVHMSASSLLYDGQIMAKLGGVLIVTIDYRLGALGFLVTGQTKFDAVGNYGILDQRLAMKWVKENIRAFGGDPSRVTLFGQSAGAQSILIHMTSEESYQYYDNVIVESSPLSIPMKKFPEAIVLGALFAELANCTIRDIHCLKRKSGSQIAYAQYLARKKISSLRLLEAFEPWGPFLDDKLISKEPVYQFQSGKFAKKPILIGTTSQETQLYVFGAWSHPVSTSMYVELVMGTEPVHGVEVMIMYPPNKPEDERGNLVLLSTDLVFGCSSRNVTQNIVKFGEQRVWMYVWDYAFKFAGWGNITFCQGFVCHGSEVPFVFQSAGLGGFTYTPDEIQLSNDVIDYWTNFAKTGDPNRSSSVKGPKGARMNWPNYKKENSWSQMRFKAPGSYVDNNFRSFYCDFWDRIGYSA